LKGGLDRCSRLFSLLVVRDDEKRSAAEIV
jgi:hypothetical protein